VTTRYLGAGIWARRTSLENSDIMLPIDKQSNHQELIQTHNNAVVAPSTNGDNASWIPCDGFDKIGITFKNNGVFSSSIYILFSNDGVNMDGMKQLEPASTDQYKSGEVPVCAPWFKVRAYNGHTAPATITASALLKA
jgi:hypothetical protein